MKLPRWVQKLLFGKQVSPPQLLEYMSTGGLRALETRSATMPPIVFFGSVDHGMVLVKCVARTDVDAEIPSEMAPHLIRSVQQYVDSMSDYPIYDPIVPERKN